MAAFLMEYNNNGLEWTLQTIALFIRGDYPSFAEQMCCNFIFSLTLDLSKGKAKRR